MKNVDVIGAFGHRVFQRRFSGEEEGNDQNRGAAKHGGLLCGEDGLRMEGRTM
jgi:hypothetical protein